MARNDKYTITAGTLTDIADAIRAKTGKSALIDPVDMPSEIGSISGGGGGTSEYEALGKAMLAHGNADLTMPAVTTIGNSSYKPLFYNDNYITKLTIQSGTETIGYGAFATMYALTEVYVPAGCSLGTNAFQSDSALTTVTLDGALCSGSRVFASCSGLRDVYMNLTYDQLRNFSTSAFSSNNSTQLNIYLAVSQSEAQNAGSPWGASNAVMHYNTTFGPDGKPVT